MKDRTRNRAALVVGLLAGSVVGATLDVGAAGGPAAPAALAPVAVAPPAAAPAAPAPVAVAAPAAAPAADQPDRVTVVSEVLDAFATGSYAGPGVIGGIARTVIGSQQLPPPGDQAQAALLDAVLQVGTVITEQGGPGIEAFREALAPLACANPAINAGLEALAAGLEQGAADFGSTIAPFDLTAVETATFLRALTAPEIPC